MEGGGVRKEQSQFFPLINSKVSLRKCNRESTEQLIPRTEQRSKNSQSCSDFVTDHGRTIIVACFVPPRIKLDITHPPTLSTTFIRSAD
jgi:hypothetical protein